MRRHLRLVALKTFKISFNQQLIRLPNAAEAENRAKMSIVKCDKLKTQPLQLKRFQL